MTINGRTEPVKSVFYELTGNDDPLTVLNLLKEPVAELPKEEPDFYIQIHVKEWLYGKTIDLTRPLDKSAFDLYVRTFDAKEGARLSIAYGSGKINVSGNATVTAGTLHITRNGDDFTVKFSVTLSDGNSFSADLQGRATKVQQP